MTSPPAPYRILIVDDDEYQLAAMRRVLHGHFETVTTKDPVLALKVFELQGPFAVVISDFQMPLINGVQLLAKIFDLEPKTQRILITGHASLQMAIDAVNHGKITAFLTKPTPNVSIRSVVCEAVQTYQHLTETATRSDQLSTDAKRACRPPAPIEPSAHLTVKEMEVLLLLVKGFSNEEISTELHVTVGTVKTHVNSLFNKLEVNNRTKAVSRAQEMGLINRATASQQKDA